MGESEMQEELAWMEPKNNRNCDILTSHLF